MKSRVGDHPEILAAARRLRRYNRLERLLAAFVAAGFIMLATVGVVVVIHVVV